MSLLNDIMKSGLSDMASIVEDGVNADLSGYVDTGSYVLNAILSGSIWKGLAQNRITAIAGSPSTGKTYIVLTCIKNFLNDNKTGVAIILDSENAITKDQCVKMGIDVSRMMIIPVSTIEEMRNVVIKILDGHEARGCKDPLFLALDSLGLLSSMKEISDISENKSTADMGKQKLMKAAFRVLTLRLGKLKVPFIVNSHVYTSQGSYVPFEVMAGGNGLSYAASSIIFLSKSKDKDSDKNVIGVNITARVAKSRLTIENSKATFNVNFVTGLNRFSGMCDLAVEAGVIKATDRQYIFPAGRAFESKVLEEPEKYFTKDILDAIDVYCGKTYLYGSQSITPVQTVQTEKKGKK